jgi:hypothetical protein
MGSGGSNAGDRRLGLTSIIRRKARMRAGKMALPPRIAWRRVSADSRALPDFVIVGAQRAGTTSLYSWLCAQPSVKSALRKEVHYFDVNYDKGERWYKAHYLLQRDGVVTGEASPYMLFHPLAPERAARDLPPETKFIALLREPVSRVVSQYWHERTLGFENETFERAIELEPERLRGAERLVAEGGRSYAHQHYSYVARSEYAGQLKRWIDAVTTERLLVVESEKLFVDPSVGAGLLDWLALPACNDPFPTENAAPRKSKPDSEVISRLKKHFEAPNEELFELLGREMWTD